MPRDASPRIHELLSRDEIAWLTEPSDRRGLWSLTVTYAMIA